MNVINAATQYRLRKIINIEVIRKSCEFNKNIVMRYSCSSSAWDNKKSFGLNRSVRVPTMMFSCATGGAFGAAFPLAEVDSSCTRRAGRACTGTLPGFCLVWADPSPPGVRRLMGRTGGLENSGSITLGAIEKIDPIVCKGCK